MEKAKLAALQSQIKLCQNLIAKHDQQKSKKKSAILNQGSSTSSTLCNTYQKVPAQTKSINTQITVANQPLNLKFTNGNTSLGVPYKTFHNKTLIINRMKSPASKTSFINHKLPVKHFTKKSTMSWSSTHKYISDNKRNAVLCKKTNSCVGNPLDFTNVPKLQDLRSTVKSTPYINVKLNDTSKHVKNAQSSELITRTPLKGEISESNPNKTFCKELTAIIEQLKHVSNTLSSNSTKCVKPSTNLDNIKSRSKFVNSSKLASGHMAKNIVSSVLTPKSSLSVTVPKLSTPKLKTTLFNDHQVKLKTVCAVKATGTTNSPLSCISKNAKLIPQQSVVSKQSMENMKIAGSKLLERTMESRPGTCFKLVKKSEKTQIIAASKTPVSIKKKVTATKLIPPKSGMADGLSLILKTRAVQENLKTAYESQLKRSQLALPRKVELEPFKIKAKLLNSKYKVVNKNYSANNVKGNFSVSPLQKGLKTPVSTRKRKSYECVQKSKKLKTPNRSPYFKSNPMTSIGHLSNKSHPKTAAKKIFNQSILLTRPKVNALNSRSKSEFKAIYKTPSKSWNKVSKGLKVGSNKLLSFSTDVDLLMELAAEKNSSSIGTPKPRDRSVLLKRLFKSKNRIINKNVSSVRVKTAKMIKSKYFASNKRYLCHTQAKSRNFPNFKPFQGGHKSFQAKFHAASFYNHRMRRIHSKHKISNYTSSSYSLRSIKKIQYPQNRLAFGTFKSFKRISGSRAVFSKTYNIKKSSTPTSKSLASRVLQHSINRVLTASVKKKMSKVNTYCMFYNRFGRCNKGTKCPYIHDPSKIAICTRFLRGTCKIENCLFSHEICPGKMAICSFFLSGSCTKVNCPYRHEMLSPGTELCKAFVKGYCPDGKQCKKAHVLVCPEYVKGFCSKGTACAFPHPPPKEKKIIEKTAEICENLDNDDFLMEKVSRYFQPSEETPCGQDFASSNLVVPKRKNLPEQPSFISLSIDDCES